MSIIEQKRKALMMPSTHLKGKQEVASLSEENTLVFSAAYEGRAELQEITGNFLQDTGFSSDIGTITHYTFHFSVLGGGDTGMSADGYFYIKMPNEQYYHFYTKGFEGYTSQMVPYNYYFDTETNTFYAKTVLATTPVIYDVPAVTIATAPKDNYKDFCAQPSTVAETNLGMNGFLAHETIPNQTYHFPLLACRCKRVDGESILLRGLPNDKGEFAMADSITYTEDAQHIFKQCIGSITLTGKEDIGMLTQANSLAHIFTIPLEEYGDYTNASVVPLCTHFRGEAVMHTSLSNHAISHLHHLNGNHLYIRADGWQTAEDFAAFLTSEYEKNTPVTIWYPLEMPWKHPNYPIGEVTPPISNGKIQMATLGHFSLPKSMRYVMYFDDVVPQHLTYIYHSFRHSFAGIQQIVRQGLAPRYFGIGDRIPIYCGGFFYDLDVIGIDHDIPYNKDFTHSLTLQFHESLAYSAPFDTKGNGWADSELRAWLNQEFLEQLEQNLAAVLGEVLKTNETNGSMDSTEKVFLLSVEEVCGIPDPGATSSGHPYAYYQMAIGSPKNLAHTRRAKHKEGVTTTRQWWLRTTVGNTIVHVSQAGAMATSMAAHQSICVCPAFNIV